MARQQGRGSSEPEVGERFDRLTPRSIPSIRLAVGLGEPERERALIPRLVESGELFVYHLKSAG